MAFRKYTAPKPEKNESLDQTLRGWRYDLVQPSLRVKQRQKLPYNTSASGIVLFLNKAKPKQRQHRVRLVNASQIFKKENLKNFIPSEFITV